MMKSLLIAANQQLLRSVKLPLAGTVLVRTGQVVNVGDPIAEATVPGHFQVFDVVNHLRVDPAHLDRHILRLAGEEVKRGDVIAKKSGLLSRFFRAPEDGKIASIRGGRVTLALGEKKIRVFANLPGTITELIPERGAVISLGASVLQGSWGNGYSARGELVRLPEDFSKIDSSSPHADVSNKIIFMPAFLAPDQLERLLEQHPAGIVVPAIPPQALPRLLTAELAVLSLSGFGDNQADALSMGMIERMAGKTVYLINPDPTTGDDDRPELILPGEGGQVGSLSAHKPSLRLGAKVRMLGMPYSGSIGTVIELPGAAERFASGLTARPVVIQRADDQVIRIPVVNVELIN